MSQVLSQSEVDALLSAVSEGEVETESHEKQDQAGVIAYDLTSQDRIIRTRIPTLDIVYEKFIRHFRITLSAQLRRLATINVSATDLLKFGEFMNTLPLPSCMNIIRFENLRGMAIIVVESKLAYALVDSFLGGSDRPFTKIEGKEFTQIEFSIVRRVVEAALLDLEKAWSQVHKMTISYIRPEVNPQFVGIVPPSDVVIATTFEVELENASGIITLVIPYSTIEPIKQKLSSGFQHEQLEKDNLWTDRMVRHLEQMDLNLAVKLGETDISMGEFMNLKQGDVVPLMTDASAELNVDVEEVMKFKGFFGASRGRRSIQITQIVENTNKDLLMQREEEEKTTISFDDF